MPPLTKCIGKYARRYTLSLYSTQTQKYILLYALVDVLEPDMQDYPADPAQAVSAKPIVERSKNSQGTNEYNVYLSIDVVQLTKEFIEKPYDNFVVGGTAFETFSTEFVPKPLSNECALFVNPDETGAASLRAILPHRRCVPFINCLIANDRVAEHIILSNDYLQQQLSVLSQEHLGFDMLRFKEHIGNIYFVSYHSVVRGIEVSASYKPSGIVVEIAYRKRQSGTLNINIVNRYKDQIYIETQKLETDGTQRLCFVPLKEVPGIIDIDITDEDRHLIYSARGMHFIRSINSNVSVKEFDLAVDDKSTGKPIMVPKYSSAGVQVIGDKNPTDTYFSATSDEQAYRVLEEQLMFAFFDGSKDPEKKADNMSRAKYMLQKILNTAKSTCYICDPYFCTQNFEDYVVPIKNGDVKVCILTSNLVDKTEQNKLKDAVASYNKMPMKGKVSVRVLKGEKSSLHDRYIATEDRIWLMGCSFNNFGERATTITKVPETVRRHIMTTIDRWWTDSNLSSSLING